MSVECLTPLPEVYSQSQRVIFKSPFPDWVNKGGIGVDLHQTEHLMNIGGISQVTIIGKTEGGKNAQMPICVGIGPDGSGYAGMGKVKEKISFPLESKSKNNGAFKNSEWASVVIRFDPEETRRQIDSQKGKLRQVNPWVSCLDQVLRRGIRKAGTEHLLTNFTQVQKFTAAYFNLFIRALAFFPGDLIVNGKLTTPETSVIIFNLIFISTVVPAICLSSGFLRYGLEDGSGSGYRISAFPGYEIDRAVILQLLSRTNRLIKPIEPSKNSS